MSAKNIHEMLNNSNSMDENIYRDNKMDSSVFAQQKLKNSQHFETLAIGNFIEIGNSGEKSNITLNVSKNKK